MQIGIFITSFGIASTLEGQVQQAVDIETEGFESFWRAQTLSVDALTVFALAGPRTNNLKMGTAVIPTFTRHPVALAQQALTAQEAAGGRITLGIGLSHKSTVEQKLGLIFDRLALRMEEYLLVLRPLLDQHKVSFRGKTMNVDAELSDFNVNSNSVIIAALGPKMLHIAGTLADGTVTWMVGPKTLDTHIVPIITNAARIAGRPDPRICVGVPVAVTDDRKAGTQAAIRNFERYGNLPSYQNMLKIEGHSHPSQMAIIGNEIEVEREIRAYSDVGTTEFLASPFPVGSDEGVSLTRTRALLKSLVGKI
jgi:F420-dependent oxidoreductase-like protein